MIWIAGIAVLLLAVIAYLLFEILHHLYELKKLYAVKTKADAMKAIRDEERASGLHD